MASSNSNDGFELFGGLPFHELFDTFIKKANNMILMGPGPLLLEKKTTTEFATTVDVVEGADGTTIVSCDLPGMKPEDVTVEVKDNILRVSGNRRRQEFSKTDKSICTERSWGSFSRHVHLDSHVNQDEIKAEFENGVLHVMLPRKRQLSETKPRAIPILKAESKTA
jgi:HSP20 family protein